MSFVVQRLLNTLHRLTELSGRVQPFRIDKVTAVSLRDAVFEGQAGLFPRAVFFTQMDLMVRHQEHFLRDLVPQRFISEGSSEKLTVLRCHHYVVVKVDFVELIRQTEQPGRSHPVIGGIERVEVLELI